jgi:hypothetical protein
LVRDLAEYRQYFLQDYSGNNRCRKPCEFLPVSDSYAHKDAYSAAGHKNIYSHIFTDTYGYADLVQFTYTDSGLADNYAHAYKNPDIYP